jgi:uncharacterized protein with PIN domain
VAPRFIVDEHAGKLARWLRLIGCDTLYFNPIRDADLAEVAARDGRSVLTRDTSLAQRYPQLDVFRLDDDDPFRQLAAVVRGYQLDWEAQAFTRCMACNGLLRAIDKEAYRDAIPTQAFEMCRQFARCTSCGKLYWDGTHYMRMKRQLRLIAQGGR